MNIMLAIASVLTAITWGIHTFVGGPTIAKPLLQSPLEPVAKLTSYYCWHVVTLTLAAMAVAYAYAAFVESAVDVAIFVTALALAYMGWSVVLTLWKRRTIADLPQWILFGLICTVAVIGLMK